MAFKGSLREASLADVCQLLALGQKSGCLSVADGSRFAQIFFDRGRITYARILNRRDRLGDILVRDGVLAQSQLDEVLKHQAREPDRRVGELLVEYEHIQYSDLTNFIRLQIEEAIYHLFTWASGNFYFEVDARPDEADVVVSINPESLLLEAARRVDEWSQIEKKIPSLDLLFEMDGSRADAHDNELTTEQRQITALLDGTRTVLDIVEETGMTEFDVGKSLFGLLQAGLARQVGRRSVDGVRGRHQEIQERRNLAVAFYGAGMLEDALREFERVLELDAADFRARYHLTLIALREGRYRDAVGMLQALLEERGGHYGTFFNLAVALRVLGRYPDAQLVLDEAERLRPGAPATRLARAITLVQAGHTGEAETAFADYVSRLPAGVKPTADYFYFSALNLAVSGRPRDADAQVGAGLDLHPESPPLLLLSGVVSERRGDLDSADRAYRQALDEDPSLAQAHKSLGDVAYRRGAHPEALQHYTRAVELQPDLGDDVYAKLGNICYKLTRLADAAAYWERALALNPDNVIVRNNLEAIGDASG
jgi:tetratricopeptide (TPR) repeat protein